MGSIIFGKRLIKVDAERPCYISVIGGPGSGKTTQSRFIYELFDFVHLSTGQILREAVAKKKIPNSEAIQKTMNDGDTVDSDLVIKLLVDTMEKQSEKHIVMDGFPINEDNYETWNMVMQSKSKFAAVFYFEITEDEMKRRLLERNEREDDNEMTIKQRIRTFNYQTKPLIEFFRNRGKITIFDGMKTKEEIYADVKEEIMKRKLYK